MINFEEYFICGEASSQQREFLKKIMDLGLSFMSGATRDNLVLRYIDNDMLKTYFSEPLPMSGGNLDEIYTILRDKVVKFSIAQSDPRYLAFPDSGNSLATLSADILAAFLNQNLIAVDRSAPSATFVELQLILWLRELIGYSTHSLRDLPNLNEVGGMWTSGGNMSNYVAVLVALHQRFPEIMQAGLQSLDRRPVIIQAKEIAHFSFAGAATALGLGSESIMWVKANPDYSTDTESVLEALRNCPDDKKPFMVVCVAGNCRTACFDNIKKMREICDSHGLWLHVDACHGGNLLFSPELRKQFLDGIEQADSVSLDPHKGLFLTYPSSYVLFRDPKCLGKLCRYPEKVLDSSCLDIGLITPFFGSRGFQSLKLWLLIKHLGLNGLRHVVEARQKLNHKITKMLEETGYFTFFNQNYFYRLAFVFCPKHLRVHIPQIVRDEEDRIRMRNIISSYTREFCNTLYKSGEVVFDLFSLQDLNDKLCLGTKEGYNTMGMAIGHSLIPEKIIKRIKDKIRRVGKDLNSRMLEDVEQIHPITIEMNSESVSGPAGWK
ncbi:MAG: aspartate aminotransferase family protein [Nitrospirae bacterium]|nr:aspartate aminotransferase family protein [Nitrospirota bacterium]